MIQQEKNAFLEKDIDTWYNYIFNAFKDKYEYCSNKNGEKWFKTSKECFHLCDFGEWFNGFIIEYASEATEEAMGMAEDGDQYPLLDYETPEDMLRDMIKEIES